MEDDEKIVKPTLCPVGRIPMRSVRFPQNNVGLGKRGSGIEISYEFARRFQLEHFNAVCASSAKLS